MRYLLLITILLLGAATAHAQVSNGNAKRLQSGTAIPTQPCSPGPPYRDVYIRTTTGIAYQCTAAPDTWSTITSGGTPGGSDTQVQFNDGGNFGGDAGLTYVKATDALSVAGSVTIAGTTPMTGTTGTGGNVVQAAGATVTGLIGDNTSQLADYDVAALPGTCTSGKMFHRTGDDTFWKCLAAGNSYAQTWLSNINTSLAEINTSGVDAGSNDTYVVTLSPAITSYAVGSKLRFFPATANTGAATVNFNGLGALTLVKTAGGITTALADNDIRAGAWVECVVAASSNCQVISNLGNAGGATFADPSASVGLAAVNGVATTAMRSDGAPALSQSIAPTWTGLHTFSATTAASTPSVRFTSPPYTAGSGTTNFPSLFYQPTAGTTAQTNWNAAGTVFGINAADAFTGDLMKLQLGNSGAKFTFSAGGVFTTAGTITGGNSVYSATTGEIGFGAGGRSKFTSSANGLIELQSTGGNAFTRLSFGGTTNSFSAVSFDAVNGFSIKSAAGTDTYNDGSTANSGTVANRCIFCHPIPTLTSTGTSVTYTTAATVFIGGAPVDSTNVTSTTKYALNVDAGLVRIGGLSSDATHTDSSVCQDTTTHALYAGSGTLGVCLGTSSARFKNRINPLSDGLSVVTRLQPKRFFYNVGQGDSGARENVGLIAEDVQKVAPRLVGLDANGAANSVDLMGVVPMLINSIKELNAKVDAQAKEIRQLRRQARRHR